MKNPAAATQSFKMYLEEVGQSTDGTHEILNASLQTSNQALLVTNIQTQGIENKEKCSSRYSPDEFKLKPNHFSQNHVAHYCSLFEKNYHFSDVLLLSSQENSPIHYLKTRQKCFVIFHEQKHNSSTPTVRSTTRK